VASVSLVFCWVRMAPVLKKERELMKKFPLLGVSVAFAAVLASSPAQAYTVWFDFQGSFAMMYESSPVEPVSSLTGNVVWNYDTGTGTANFTSPLILFGVSGNLHDITLTAMRVGVAHADMLFDWAGNQNIHVTADFGMTPYFGGGYDLITLDGDQDGVAGNAMSGGFAGLSMIFSGKMSGGCPYVEPEFCANPGMPPQIVPVPVLPAMWLLISGLAGLVGFGRLGRK